MTLIIDFREIRLIEACQRLHLPHRVSDKELPVGDVTNEDETFIAERKGFEDFWKSMVDGRTPNQEWRMYEGYSKNRYVFVEVGTLSDLAEERKKDKNWIYSMFGVIENWDCNFREYNDMEDLALKLFWLDQKLGGERVVRDVQVKLYNKTTAQKVLRGFQGLGNKADDMLKKCITLKAVLIDLLNHNGEKLSEVHGIANLPKGKILSRMLVAMNEKHA